MDPGGGTQQQWQQRQRSTSTGSTLGTHSAYTTAPELLCAFGSKGPQRVLRLYVCMYDLYCPRAQRGQTGGYGTSALPLSYTAANTSAYVHALLYEYNSYLYIIMIESAEKIPLVTFVNRFLVMQKAIYCIISPLLQSYCTSLFLGHDEPPPHAEKNLGEVRFVDELPAPRGPPGDDILCICCYVLSSRRLCVLSEGLCLLLWRRLLW